MTDTAALFEQTAAHDIPAEHPLSRSEGVRIDATLALLPPGVETALDVGCGPGTLLHRLPVPRAYGTDLGWRGLRNVQRPAVRSSILRLPFADASVDLVTCCEVLEHLPPADVAAAVAELCRVARRAVLVTVPYREQLLESSHRCPRCGTEFHLHGHQQSLDEASILPLFPVDARLTVQRVWKVRPYSPALLRLRTRGLGLWKHGRHTLCPSCGNTEFENHEGRLLYKLFGALNHLRHPRRSQDNWLLVRADLAGGEP
ncbi:MAG: class I SAM-dependent methyltransferase [Myxococcales bacterium]|nr:class I SAM-dependent methyltransferase [Myxococcales bacterium]